MSSLPDITSSAGWAAKTPLRARYERDVGLQSADAEICLGASARGLTCCPAIFWPVDDGNLVIFKSGGCRYRCRFFFKPYRQFGTGAREYDDLTECTITLLQAEADQTAGEGGGLEKKRH